MSIALSLPADIVAYPSADSAAAAMPAAQAFLAIREVSKRFGAFTALDQVSLDVRQGEMVSAGSLRLRKDHAVARHRRSATTRPGQHSRPWQRHFTTAAAST